MSGSQAISDEIRDKVFASIRHEGDNNMCLDCEKRNTKWASVHLGIHLCYDCAAKHRQYGVAHSFIRSINLDSWNRKQLLFMEKGSNARALQYFRKCGLVTQANRHIDYTSPVVTKYQQLLTIEVQNQIAGPTHINPHNANKTQNNKEAQKDVNTINMISIAPAEEVQEVMVKKGRTKKKIGATKVKIQDFENNMFDDGFAQEEKQKIIQAYSKLQSQPAKELTESKKEQVVVQQAPKQLSSEDAQKKIEELKSKNIKTISSDSFKDTEIDNVKLKETMNKFQNSKSISSSAFYNKEEPSDALEKIKDIVSDAGEKFMSKIFNYWK